MDQLVHAFLPASRFATRISHLKSLLPSLSSFSIAIHCSYDSRNIHCPISRLDSHRLLRISTNPISTTQSQNLFLPPQWTVFLFPSSASSVVPTRTLATAKLSALPSASPVPLSLQLCVGPLLSSAAAVQLKPARRCSATQQMQVARLAMLYPSRVLFLDTTILCGYFRSRQWRSPWVSGIAVLGMA